MNRFANTKKAAFFTVIVWLAAAVLLSIAPSAGDYAVNNGENDLPESAASAIAEEKADEYFPDEEGLLTLLVPHRETGWTDRETEQLEQLTRWTASEADGQLNVKEVLPFHEFPEEVQRQFLSDDSTTMIVPLFLNEEMEAEKINQTTSLMMEKAEEVFDGATSVYITGPGGISADTVEIFANADLVLLFSTIGIVFILLIVLYRSPLLALIPLFGAALVYQVVDRSLGLLAAAEIFTLEAQALSIVMILLFGATVDYSLFIFSRFKEELYSRENKYEAMDKAVRGVQRPIFFSGATVFAALAVLITADYGPYSSFAPTFTLTIVVVLAAGLTLIPALFVLFGRRAFWPFIPEIGSKKKEKRGFWFRLGILVTKKPYLLGGIVLVFLLFNAANVPNITYSFNLTESFPEDMSSREGLEVMEERFPVGELAPGTILLEGDISEEEAERAAEQVKAHSGIAEAVVEDKTEGAAALTFLMEQNPYSREALDAVDSLREDGEFLTAAGIDNVSFYVAGETASQADVRSYSASDTWRTAALVTAVIFIMLMWQTRSWTAPIYMTGTILLSYLSALGLSWYLVEPLFGYEALSYRIPLYSFVFLVALGVDYNIMLISRIQEENNHYPLIKSVQRGIGLTGGVISSAGVILAATFGVLMTQPLMELVLFGFIVAIGLLVDAFLVRGILVPAVVTILGSKNNWKREEK
jgi:putative drug exporter of the RND superfamily